MNCSASYNLEGTPIITCSASYNLEGTPTTRIAQQVII